MRLRAPTAAVLALIAALAVAVPLAACGGENGASKDDYREDARAIADKLKADLGTAQQRLNSQDEKQIVNGLNQFRASLAEAKSKLGALEPPEDFQDVHDRLVAELNTLEQDVRAVADSFAAKDQARVQRAVQKMQADVQDLQQAGNEFDKKVGTGN